MYHGTLWSGVDDGTQWTGGGIHIVQLFLVRGTLAWSARGRAEAVVHPAGGCRVTIALGSEWSHDGTCIVLVTNQLLDIGMIEAIT